MKCGWWIFFFILFFLTIFPYWKSRGKEENTPCSPPNLQAKYCFTSHISACQYEARGISASTQHISPHTHTLVQLKMKKQKNKKRAWKHILHFITIKTESGGRASTSRLIQKLYFFVYRLSWLTDQQNPINPWSFPTGVPWVSDSADQWISSASSAVTRLAPEYVWTAGSENEPTVQLWFLTESE